MNSAICISELFECYLNQIIFSSKIPRSSRIGAAVSGGSDSLSMALLLDNYCKKYGFELIIYTLDHHLRPESGDEVIYVRKILSERGIMTKILEWHHEDINITVGRLERLARKARYEIITNECLKDSVRLLALGHTADDQVETYMMRLSHGSYDLGLAGMSAISKWSDGLKLIRPLLHFRKEQMRGYLSALGVAWVDDPSNEDQDFMRVRARYELRENEELFRDIQKKLGNYGRQRAEFDKRFNEFVLKNVIFNHFSCSFESTVLNELRDDLLMQIRKLLWMIGGSEYPCSITPLAENIKSSRSFTISRCCFNIIGERVLIYRENKNFSKVPLDEITFWDNRFIIRCTKSKIGQDRYVTNLHEKDVVKLRKIGLIKNEKMYILLSIPAIYSQNGNLLSAPTIGYKPEGFMVEFNPPVDYKECFFYMDQWDGGGSTS